MFQSIRIDQILDPNASADHPAYWLAQLRKVDWHELLRFVEVKASKSSKRQPLAELALSHCEFVSCEGRAEVWQMWTDMQREKCQSLVIQFRHPETDWTRGTPEFVHLDQGEPLGFVNIAARWICRVK